MSTNDDLLKTLQALDGEQIKTLLTALLSNTSSIRGQTEDSTIVDEFETPTKKKRGRPKKEQLNDSEFAPINHKRSNGSLQLGQRPNNFESMGLAKQCKEDSKIDAILNKSNSNRERDTRPKYQKIKAKCLGCGKVDSLDKNLVWTDFETKEIVYKCNTCSRKS